MDIAYDHIQEEVLSPEEAQARDNVNNRDTNLNTEFQEAFKAVSASPWGAKLGGFFGQVRKQGESFYSDAQKEYANRSEQAAKGLTDLRSSLAETTRNLSIQPEAGAANTSFSDPTFALPESSETPKAKEKEREVEGGAEAERPESLPADIVKEATSLVSRFRSEAAKRLKNVQKAEDAADEALLKFGTNIKSFLRDAVKVTAPSEDSESSQVLFETNDAEGKRVIHSSRFDAQLHVVHSTAQSFTSDPDSPEYAAFAKEFDIEGKTDAIAADLEKYTELRRAMEKLVPEKVDYPTFWTRYYFLRKVIQEEEQRRREVLKGATQDADEEIAWGSDDSDDEDKAPTPTTEKATTEKASSASTSTKPKDTLNPRQSHEEDGKSTAGSDASYDIVSGATSRTQGSPKEEKAEPVKKIEEESDEEDWE